MRRAVDGLEAELAEHGNDLDRLGDGLHPVIEGGKDVAVEVDVTHGAKEAPIVTEEMVLI